MDQSILLKVALPGLIAGVLIAAATLVAAAVNRSGKRPWAAGLISSIGGAVAIGIGFLVSFRYVEGVPPSPPHTWHWIAYMAVAATVIGCLHGLWAQLKFASLITGVLLGAVAMFMLHPLSVMEHPWRYKAGLGVGEFVLYLAMNPLAARRTGHAVPLAMMFVFTAASLVLVEARSAKYGELNGALACMAGVIMAIGLLARNLTIAGGAMAVMCMLLPAWMMLGWFYDDGFVPPAAFIIIAAAPLALWLGEWPRLRRGSGWRGWCAGIGAVVVIAGGAVVFAMAPFPAEAEESERTEYEYENGY